MMTYGPESLPPMMGMEHECHYEVKDIHHYTAILNNHRVFVFPKNSSNTYGPDWLIEIDKNCSIYPGDPNYRIYFLKERKQYTIPIGDVLTLRAVLEELTSGGNHEISAPATAAGAVDGGHPLSDQKSNARVNVRGAGGSEVGT